MYILLCTGLLILQYWYWCDSIDDTYLVLPRVSLILLVRSIANSVADIFMSKKNR